MLRRLRDNARDKYRNLCEEEKIKRDNMEEIGIIICLKKSKKTHLYIKKKIFIVSISA